MHGHPPRAICINRNTVHYNPNPSSSTRVRAKARVEVRARVRVSYTKYTAEAPKRQYLSTRQDTGDKRYNLRNVLDPPTMTPYWVLSTIYIIAAIVAPSSAWSSSRTCSLRLSKQLRHCQRDRQPAAPSSADKYVRYFEQALDHFDPQNERTWKQRWFVNDAYFSNDKRFAPVFLCVGGEGPALSAAVVTEHNIHCSNMVSLAEQHHGLIVAVEHRFYGQSMPLPDFTNKALAYLSSRQALADLSTIHEHVTSRYGLSRRMNPWIAFGGSYPGMLASFFRIKYPHLCWAAVASSAPVEAVANFQGYNNVVAESLGNPAAGGSASCRKTIADAFAHVGQLLTQEKGRDKLVMDFKICQASALEDIANQRVFALFLSYLFPVQGNDPACTASLCNIEKICAAMVGTSEGYDSLVKLVGRELQGSCIEVNATQEVDALLNTSAAAGGDRSWLYQTCTEFGFYQTCDPHSDCIFVSNPHLSTLKYNLDLCQKLFGVKSDVVLASIQRTNTYYGGDFPLGASRILYPSGQVDPWKASSIVESVSPQLEAFTVEGASHHFWTHPSRASDSKQVQQARQRIDDKVESWLKSFQQFAAKSARAKAVESMIEAV